MRRRQFLLACALAASGGAGAARDSASLSPAVDLREDGRAAGRQGVPIIVLFSLPGCPHCEVVRTSYLAPMQRDARQARRAVVRQVDLGSDRTLTTFRGTASTHGQFAREQGIRVAPVVAFWDGEGRALAPPLEGLLLPDFYGAYFEEALAAAEAKLRGRG